MDSDRKIQNLERLAAEVLAELEATQARAVGTPRELLARARVGAVLTRMCAAGREEAEKLAVQDRKTASDSRLLAQRLARLGEVARRMSTARAR